MAKSASKGAAYMREYRKRNPARFQGYELKRHYGISVEDYQSILRSQGGVCAICGEPPGSAGTGDNSVGTLAVDHSHSLVGIRGLLCTNCNLGIGSFYESVEFLRKAADYLERHEKLVADVRKKLYGP